MHRGDAEVVNPVPVAAAAPGKDAIFGIPTTAELEAALNRVVDRFWAGAAAFMADQVGWEIQVLGLAMPIRLTKPPRSAKET